MPPSRTFRRAAPTLVVAVAAAAVLGLAACSGARADSGSAATSTTQPGGGTTPAVGDPVAASGPAPSQAGDLFVVEGSDGTAKPDGTTWTVSMAVSADVLAFTDRPARGATRLSASELVDGWGSYGFVDDPPNAALSATGPDGADIDVAVELTEPRWDASTGRLTVTARPIGSDVGLDLPTSFESVRLFVDDAAQGVGLWISVQPGAPITVLDSGGAQLVGCTEQIGPQDIIEPPGCSAMLVNPTPGEASAVSLRLGSTSVNWLTIEWDLSIQFAADGTVTGTVTMPWPPSPDYAFWPVLLGYEELAQSPGAELPLNVEVVDGQPQIELLFMSTSPPD